jgi:pyridoxine 5-phosphate synthase
MAEQAGADTITVHLREDRRHIQVRDVELLSEVIETRLNLEMAVTDEMVSIAERLRPADCCLVPERREELTTEGGLDVAGQLERVREVCRRLAAAGVPVVELHTGRYADRGERQARQSEFDRVMDAARQAAESGITVHAGHGLNYHNVKPIAAIPQVSELNIGHAIVARAVFIGLTEAVREMKRLLREARLPGMV